MMNNHDEKQHALYSPRPMPCPCCYSSIHVIRLMSQFGVPVRTSNDDSELRTPLTNIRRNIVIDSRIPERATNAGLRRRVRAFGSRSSTRVTLVENVEAEAVGRVIAFGGAGRDVVAIELVDAQVSSGADAAVHVDKVPAVACRDGGTEGPAYNPAVGPVPV